MQARREESVDFKGARQSYRRDPVSLRRCRRGLTLAARRAADGFRVSYFRRRQSGGAAFTATYAPALEMVRCAGPTGWKALA